MNVDYNIRLMIFHHQLFYLPASISQWNKSTQRKCLIHFICLCGCTNNETTMTTTTKLNSCLICTSVTATQYQMNGRYFIGDSGNSWFYLWKQWNDLHCVYTIHIVAILQTNINSFHNHACSLTLDKIIVSRHQNK